MSGGKPRSPLLLAFGIVFLDIVGFSILFPLFPAMLEHYLALEGEGGTLGRLAARLTDWAGDDQHAVVTLFGGLLGSFYSLLQFLFAPVWGGLSDRIGRRPTLIVTIAGTLAGYVLWVFAGSFALLIVSRLVAGVMAGNIATATAVVADVTEERERAKGMGIVGMAIGLGFVLGPAIGGLAWTFPLFGAGDADAAWRSGLALNPFSTPALAACLLAAGNLALVLFAFRETLPAERRGQGGEARVLNPFARLSTMQAPGLVRTQLVYFLFLLAFAAMEFTLTFLAVERLGYTPADNTWMFVYVGLVLAFVQGGLVRRLAPRFGERRLATGGLALLVPGFLAVAAASSSGMLYAGLTLMAVGSACSMPALSALASLYAPPARQGLALGTFRSLGSLSRAIGPVLGGLLYFRYGSAAPYLGGALFLLLPLGLALGLPPVATRPEGRPPEGPPGSQ